MGQIQLTTFFCAQELVFETRTHLRISTAAFMLLWQNSEVLQVLSSSQSLKSDLLQKNLPMPDSEYQ